MFDHGKGKEKDGPDGAPQVDSCPFLDCWLPLHLRQVLALTAVLLALVAMIGWFQCGWVSDDHDVETAETLANKGSLCSYEGASILSAAISLHHNIRTVTCEMRVYELRSCTEV
jgi:hypothetical protein